MSNNSLGIKQLLQQQLLQIIYLYRQQNKISDSWDHILISLSDKLVLRNIINHKIATKKDFSSEFLADNVVYRCAIAFPLANICGVEPLTMAQDLVSFLAEINQNELPKAQIEVMIKVLAPGWIDFYLKPHFLGVWLQQLQVKLASNSSDEIRKATRYKNLQFWRENSQLFLINYYHARCCSLLRLGEREGLIKLDSQNFLSLTKSKQAPSSYKSASPGETPGVYDGRGGVPWTWQIIKPRSILWFDATKTFLLIQPQELNLLRSILFILDLFDSLTGRTNPCYERRGQPLTPIEAQQHYPMIQSSAAKIWINAGLHLSEALAQSIAACRFCGEIKQQNPQLALARLGLIALVQWCLFKLLWEIFKIVPWKQL
ncbi:MAG TPA: hypothetical protein ACFCUY_18675 [Xenococcaceae cyanobacterium]